MQEMDRKPSGKDGNTCVFNAAKFSLRIFFFNPAHLQHFASEKVVSCTLFSTSSGQLQFSNYYVTQPEAIRDL